MKTLQLFIDASWPDQHSECEWRLLDASGHTVSSGSSEPRHWPGVKLPYSGDRNAAEDSIVCELILGSDEAVRFSVQLPPGKTGRQREVVAFALEDRLTAEPESYHFALGEPNDDGTTEVICIPRHRLHKLLASLNSVGVVPCRIIIDAQLRPLTDSVWQLVASRQGATLITSSGWLQVDTLEKTSPAPELLVALATPEGSQCTAIELDADIASRCEITAWQAGLGIPLRQMTTAAPAAPQRLPINLLQGEFSPPRSGLGPWRGVSTAAKLLVAGFLIFVLVSLGDWAWMAYQVRSLKAEQKSFFLKTFPQATSALMPPLQMQRSVDEARRRHGLLGENDFLSLAAALAGAGIQHVEGFRYAQGRLEAEVVIPTGHSLESITRRLNLQGISLVTTHQKSVANGVQATLILRRGAAL
jgi:general secretion pathway protein L